MGWKFWKLKQTEAERSLAALQQQSTARSTSPVPTTPTVAPPPGTQPSLTPREEEGMAHMDGVIRQLEDMVGAATPEGEAGRFMLEVTAVRAGADGDVVLVGGAHEGAVGPGDLVGLLVLPHGMATTDPTLPLEEQQRQHAEAWLGTRARSATVVSWRADSPDGPELVLSGLAPDDVSVGSMVTR